MNRYQRLAASLEKILSEIGETNKKADQVTKGYSLLVMTEKYVVIGRPLLTEKARKAMIFTSRLGAIYLLRGSPLADELSKTELIGYIFDIDPRIRPRNTYLSKPEINRLSFWSQKFHIPSQGREAKKNCESCSLLYFTSSNEPWTSLYARELASSSFTNQLIEISRRFHLDDLLEKQNTADAYSQLIEYGEKFSETESKAKKKQLSFPDNFSWYPEELLNLDKTTRLSDALALADKIFKENQNRDCRSFLDGWITRLEGQWYRNTEDYEPEEVFQASGRIHRTKRTKKSAAPNAVVALHINDYAALMQRLIDIFFENPEQNKSHGELILLLGVGINVATGMPNQSFSYTDLFKLTASQIDFKEGVIECGQEKFSLSYGVLKMLKAYIGDQPSCYAKKLFPNLNKKIVHSLIVKLKQKRSGMDKHITPADLTCLPEVIFKSGISKDLRRKINQASKHKLHIPDHAQIIKKALTNFNTQKTIPQRT